MAVSEIAMWNNSLTYFSILDDAIFQFKRTKHGIPSSAIMRKSVVMGTVWVFKPTEKYKFEQLCTSRMVERFGRDESNWEHVCLILSEEEVI